MLSVRKVVLLLSLLVFVVPTAWAFSPRTLQRVISDVMPLLPSELDALLTDNYDSLLAGLYDQKAFQEGHTSASIARRLEELARATGRGLPAAELARRYGELAQIVAQIHMPLHEAQWGEDADIRRSFERYLDNFNFKLRIGEVSTISSPIIYFERALERSSKDDNLIRVVYWWAGESFSPQFEEISRRYVEGAAKAVAETWLTAYYNAGRVVTQETAQPSQMAEEEQAVVKEEPAAGTADQFTQLVSATFQDYPLADFLTYIADAYKVQIIPNVQIPAVSVTIEVENQPLVQALNTALEPFGLYATGERDNIIVIQGIQDLDKLVLASGTTMTGLVTGYEDGRFNVKVDVGEVRVSAGFVKAIKMNRPLGQPAAGHPITPAPKEEVAAPTPEIQPVGSTQAALAQRLARHPRWEATKDEVITPEQASAYVDKNVAVQGVVAESYRDPRTDIRVLMFTPEDPDALKILIYPVDMRRFLELGDPVDHYKGTELRVRGLIENNNGSLEILARTPEQIEEPLY